MDAGVLHYGIASFRCVFYPALSVVIRFFFLSWAVVGRHRVILKRQSARENDMSQTLIFYIGYLDGLKM